MKKTKPVTNLQIWNQSSTNCAYCSHHREQRIEKGTEVGRILGWLMKCLLMTPLCQHHHLYLRFFLKLSKMWREFIHSSTRFCLKLMWSLDCQPPSLELEASSKVPCSCIFGAQMILTMTVECSWCSYINRSFIIQYRRRNWGGNRGSGSSGQWLWLCMTQDTDKEDRDHEGECTPTLAICSLYHSQEEFQFLSFALISLTFKEESPSCPPVAQPSNPPP